MYRIKRIFQRSEIFGDADYDCRIYWSPHNGGDDITFINDETKEEFVLANRELFDFVSRHIDEIFGCYSIDKEYVTQYALVKWTDADLKLLDLIEFERYITELVDCADKADFPYVYGLSTNHGNIFQLLCDSLIKHPYNGGNYTYDGKFGVYKIKIEDEKLYVVESYNRTAVYRIKDMDKFIKTFVKKIVLDKPAVSFSDRYVDDDTVKSILDDVNRKVV